MSKLKKYSSILGSAEIRPIHKLLLFFLAANCDEGGQYQAPQEKIIAESRISRSLVISGLNFWEKSGEVMRILQKERNLPNRYQINVPPFSGADRQTINKIIKSDRSIHEKLIMCAIFLGAGQKVSELMKATALSMSLVKKALRDLFDDGLIVRSINF